MDDPQQEQQVAPEPATALAAEPIDWYMADFTLESKVIEFRLEPLQLRKLLTDALEAYRSQTDFSDLWAGDEVIECLREHVIDRIPDQLPSYLLLTTINFLGALFDENVSSDMVQESWANYVLAAICRCKTADDSTYLQAIKALSRYGSTYRRIIKGCSDLQEGITTAVKRTLSTGASLTDLDGGQLAHTEKAIEALAASFQDTVAEEEALPIMQTFAEYVASVRQMIAGGKRPPSEGSSLEQRKKAAKVEEDEQEEDELEEDAEEENEEQDGEAAEEEDDVDDDEEYDDSRGMHGYGVHFGVGKQSRVAKTWSRQFEVLSHIFWGCSNAICDAGCESVRQTILTNGLAEAAVYFATASGDLTSRVAHESLSMLCMLSKPPCDMREGFVTHMRPIGLELFVMGAFHLIVKAFCTEMAANDLDSWAGVEVKAILALMMWTEEQQVPELIAILREEGVLPHLLALCTNAAQKTQGLMAGTSGKVKAAVLLIKKFFPDSVEDAVHKALNNVENPGSWYLRYNDPDYVWMDST